MRLVPVTLPPGWAKLATSPLAYGAMLAAIVLDLWLLLAFFRTRRSGFAAA